MNKKDTSFLHLTWIKYKSRFFFFNLIITIFLNPFSKVSAQKTEFQYGMLNIASGAVVGGIGALLNKQPDEKFPRVFAKGLAQGALGGYLVFESKRILQEFVRQENYIYVWPSKLINSTGTSIIENAAANRNFWEHWHINFAFTRLDIYTKEEIRFKYRIMPFSLFRAIQLKSRDYDIDWNRSLKLGVLVFLKDEITYGEFTNVLGALASNHISLKKSSIKHSTEAHELIHVYQNNQFSGFNPYINNLNLYLKKNFKPFRIYDTFFYTDFNSPIFRGLYKWGRIRASSSTENIFEKEAYFLSKN